MNLTPEEKADIKAMLLYLVQKKAEGSGGHNGFHPSEIHQFLDELVADGKITARDNIHSTRYFLK